MNVTLVLVIALYVFMILRGYKKGLVKMVTSVACSLFSLLVARLFTPAVSEKLLANVELVGWVSEKIIPHIKGVTSATVITALTYISLFVIALAVSKCIASFLRRASKLPVVNFVNQILGGIVAAVEATIYVWIFMLAVSMLPQLEICGTIMKQIEASEFLFILYQNDPFFALVKSITMNFPA